MQATVAIVRTAEEGRVAVELLSAGCGRCQEKGGCGGQNLTQALCSRKLYWIENRLGAKVGERVVLGTDGIHVRTAANRAYVVPLSALLGGASAGALMGTMGSVAGAGLALCCAWYWLVAKRVDATTPTMLEIIGGE